MENYFRYSSEFVKLSEKPTRSVFQVKPLQPYEKYPSNFIQICYLGSNRPEEVEIFLSLNSNSPSSSTLKIFDHWGVDHFYYMSIEYCDYESLESLLTSSQVQKPSLSKAIQFSHKLASSLFSLHTLKISHFNLILSNILVAPNWQSFKIIGFTFSHKEENFNLMTSSSVSPYRKDVKDLGRVFLEIALSRPCPEVDQMDLNSLFIFIDEQFKRLGHGEDFAELIKKMTVSIDVDLSIEEVKKETYKLSLKYFHPDVPYANPAYFTQNFTSDNIFNEIVAPWASAQEEDSKEDSEKDLQKDPVEPVPASPIYLQEHSSANPGDPHPLSASIRNPTGNCWECWKPLSGNFKQVSCDCFMHVTCIKKNYENRILETNKKIPQIVCQNCKKIIPFEFFTDMLELPYRMREKARMLSYTFKKFACPRDTGEDKSFILDEKLQARNIKCQFCASKFCSYCLHVGGHFSCSKLVELKKELKHI